MAKQRVTDAPGMREMGYSDAQVEAILMAFNEGVGVVVKDGEIAETFPVRTERTKPDRRWWGWWKRGSR